MIFNRKQLEDLALQIYWHQERGETEPMLHKLNQLQWNGLERAAQIVAPENPMARSVYAENRNEAVRLIREEMEKVKAQV